MDKQPVFIPDYAPDDIDTIRRNLLAKGLFPVLYQDLFAFNDEIDSTNLDLRKQEYFENACQGALKTGAVAIGESLLDKVGIINLGTYCKANNIPVHVYNDAFEIRPLFKHLPVCANEAEI